ncbi:pescadillo [Fistulifera solaris]|jgi:pescadillo protein|uniref:Pescadillo n=1 Tax=Fistulifera solaris TaxID=1519565 RepID=A0A1Z5KTG2_FISSO|nr:pescadillo [Fistulifera solaris]|eukprot:GAX29218.1 pescadillo [Fistulifera solaris]
MDEAQRKNALLPQYSLHHLVKERYPRFVDALSDLDDALTLTYLFASLPAHSNVNSSVINKAKNLAAAWGSYCATTSCITKSFISVKGVYLEAKIQGTAIRWIVPHAFTQHLPNDVDFRVMRTFLEFYETMLNFVLFKLYNDIGVRYPFPAKELGGEVVGNTSAVLAKTLRALMKGLDSSKGAVSQVVTESLQEQQQITDEGRKAKRSKRDKDLIKSVDVALSKLKHEESEEEEDENSDDDDAEDDDVDVSAPLRAALDQVAEDEARGTVLGSVAEVDDETVKRRRLFEGLVFFFSREIPRGYLELVCLSYGAKVGWEAEDSPISMKDSSITHHVVDRPKLPNNYDSLPKSREYIQPQWILDSANFMFLLPIAKYGVGVSLPPHLSPWVDNEEEGYKPAYAEEIEKLKNGESVDDREMEEASSDVPEMEDDEDEQGVEDEEQEEEASEDADSDEEEEELVTKPIKKTKSKKDRQKQEEEEAHALAKTMMSRKAAHLYGRMQYGIAGKQAKIDALHKRRAEIESSKTKENGKTVLKQKVERLKKERSTLETQYDASGGTMKKSKKRKST